MGVRLPLPAPLKKEDTKMKAKSHYSVLVAETVARGTLAMFAGITVFMAGFVAWSGVGFINAMIQLF